MQFFAVAALFATTALASVCPGGLLYNVPLCCATNVLELADLDCSTPTVPLGTPAVFQKNCADHGKQAFCCSIPAAGLGLLCQKAIGTQ